MSLSKARRKKLFGCTARLTELALDPVVGSLARKRYGGSIILSESERRHLARLHNTARTILGVARGK